MGEIGRKTANLINSLSDTDSPEVAIPIKEKIAELQTQKTILEAQRQTLARGVAQFNTTNQDTEKQLQSIRELITAMAEMEGQERIDLRLNLRSQLRHLIDEIKIYPGQGRYAIYFKSGEWRGLTVREDGRVLIMDGHKEWRHVPMFFK